MTKPKCRQNFRAMTSKVTLKHQIKLIFDFFSFLLAINMDSFFGSVLKYNWWVIFFIFFTINKKTRENARQLFFYFKPNNL